MKRLSVILPVYNVEEYLEKCIRSLEEQDIPKDEYEIICVNDGSPDNSREVIIKLQKEFDNLILIDQVNMGVSMARNRGLDEANGEYLLFVDPDDYIKRNKLGKLLYVAEKNEVEMLMSGYVFVDINGKITNERIFEKGENVISGIDAFYLSRRKKGITVDSSVGILFRRDFVYKYKLRYVKGVVLNQDVEFLARAHCVADRCLLVKDTLYVAVNRPGSATRSNQFSTEKVREGFVLAADNLKKFQQLKDLTDLKRIFLNGTIAKFVLLAVYSAVKTRSLKIFNQTVVKLKNNQLGKLDIKGCSHFNRTCGKAYNFSPYFGAFVIVLYQKINHWRFKNNYV